MKAKRKWSKKKKLFLILGTLLVLLIGLRIALPYILLRYVNRQLTLIDGYYGHVDDIDISLYRGAYTIKSIKLDKTNGKVPVPFFKAPVIDLSVEWQALFHGKIVAEIVVDKPELNFVKGPTKATSQTGVDEDWTVVVDHLIPFKLNRFQVNDGQIHYRDFYSNPKVDIAAKNIQIVAENLTNAKHAKDSLPSTARATADIYDGKFTLNMKIDPLLEDPTFDLNSRLTAVSLNRFNDFLKAYGNFDVEKGTISLYTEAAAKNGKLTGYSKPIIKDIKAANWKEDKDKPLKLIWESIVDAVAWVLNNKEKDQIATRASFTGNIKNPDTNTWVIIGQLLRNAFIQALYPSIENSVNLNSVSKKQEKQTLLQALFEKSGGEKKDDKKKK